MGVYIKGMEMPKDCVVCPFGWNGCNKQHDFVYMGSRPDNCPLVPVPPHGRLIDETDVINHFVELANDPWNQNVCTSWSNAFEEAAGDICDMPTVIEAEDGE